MEMDCLQVDPDLWLPYEQRVHDPKRGGVTTLTIPHRSVVRKNETVNPENSTPSTSSSNLVAAGDKRVDSEGHPSDTKKICFLEHHLQQRLLDVRNPSKPCTWIQKPCSAPPHRRNELGRPLVLAGWLSVGRLPLGDPRG
ncbi:dolichol-phosphate mannosyltransferase subunit 3 isoform X1 [Rhineura floridana]|uniref:dolichol-phosphate mannosyltransferase subunit 3 isoform X1 n=1 Tax=Rhineura floridana TaxID=261503 RepID=UPI002AC82C3B|nr:dolichol-phosphate mannosyltransferase subunit 3 isoform X1 [Rhineura floridana]